MRATGQRLYFDFTAGASKGQPKTKAKAKQFSEKENERKVETRDGRTEANAGAKASPGRKTGGAEGPGVSTARKEAKSPPGKYFCPSCGKARGQLKNSAKSHALTLFMMKYLTGFVSVGTSSEQNKSFSF